MNENELKRERRKQRTLERLGSNNPSCFICGCDDPLVLELHHIAGRAFDGETVPVCRNCHRILSDAQQDHPPPLSNQPSYLERIGHALLGLADLFELLAKWLREHARNLFAASYPNHNAQELQP
jgi:hypothetical protein